MSSPVVYNIFGRIGSNVLGLYAICVIFLTVCFGE
jgi:hypothetical protein